MHGMSRQVQIAVRLPEEVLARLDGYAVRLAEDLAGVAFTRSDAARVLIVRGLDALGDAAVSRGAGPPADMPTPRGRQPKRRPARAR